MPKSIAVVVLTSLISLASGCTLVGAGIGASASTPEHRAGPIATGVLVGLALDAALVAVAVSQMDFNFDLGNGSDRSLAPDIRW